jgi:hypothetical protein
MNERGRQLRTRPLAKAKLGRASAAQREVNERVEAKTGAMPPLALQAKSHKPESNGPDPPMMLPPVHRTDCCAQRDRGKRPNDLDDGFDRFDHLSADIVIEF